jgi:hypothetical protein
VGTRLVTVATFEHAMSADMAANVLRDAGIDAVVTGADLVNTYWLPSNAIGAIKVQVRDEDADRAVEVLTDSFGEADAGDGEPLDDRPGSDAPLPSREEEAIRLVRVARWGVLIPPAWVYAVYLWRTVAFGDGPLSGPGRRRLWLGAVLILVGLPMTLLFLRALVASLTL